MTRKINQEMTAPRRRHFLFSPAFWLPVLILALVTPIFWITDLDMDLQRQLFRDGEWFRGEEAVFAFVYHWGNIPALILVIGALLAYILSYSKAKILPYRKMTAYLVLVLALGPGLVVNSLLKDQWGRPRPRNISEFGGEFRYERPLEIDPQSDGKSFPCGHATTGYYFFALSLLLWTKRKKLAVGTFVFALAYGSLIGWARMAQGGHFFSDVIWAAVVVWLVAYLLWRLMKLDIEPWYRKRELKKLKLWQKLALILILILIVVGVSLATPYRRIHKPNLAAKLTSGRYSLHLSGDALRLSLSWADSLHLEGVSNGFGAPGSKLSYLSGIESENGEALLRIWQQKRGFFTELDSDMNLVLDSLRLQTAQLSFDELRADIVLSEVALDVSAKSGDLRLYVPADFEAAIVLLGEVELVTTRDDLQILRTETDEALHRIRLGSGRITIE